MFETWLRQCSDWWIDSSQAATSQKVFVSPNYKYIYIFYRRLFGVLAIYSLRTLSPGKVCFFKRRQSAQAVVACRCQFLLNVPLDMVLLDTVM